MNMVAKLSWGLCLSLACCAGARGAGVHHYVFFNRDREKISDPEELTSNTVLQTNIRIADPFTLVFLKRLFTP